MISRYFLFARVAPAIVCTVPFIVLYVFFLDSRLSPLFRALADVKWIGGISTVAAFTLLLALVGRAISKDLFERMLFRMDETRMPTTEYLMHSSAEYTSEFRAKVHECIEADFGITVLCAAAEQVDDLRARRTIAEAVALIRQKVRDGRLLLQHNIEYGFFRNLIGCAVLAVLTSSFNAWLFRAVSRNDQLFVASVVMIALYLLPIVFSASLMRSHGRRYARVLIQEYLSLGSALPPSTKESAAI